MPKKKIVGKRRKARPDKIGRVDRDVIEGLKLAIAHVRGEITLPTTIYHLPDPVDVKAIRTKIGASQAEFAEAFGFSVRTLQDWELGRSQPPAAAQAYLIVIDRNPYAVVEALLGTGA